MKAWFPVESGPDGIAVLTIAMAGLPLNVWNAGSIRGFAESLDEVLAQPGLSGIVLRSGRSTFLAGADLHALMPLDDVARNMALVRALGAALRRLETCGVPVVAAIDGSALGGGYELCLACHRRLARADDAIRVGLPEVRLGLLPGAGGTQRLPRLLGIRAALPLLLEGKTLKPTAALSAGLVDELAETDDALLRRAKEWILGGGEATQPWDRKGARIPGGGVQSPEGYQTFGAAAALVREKTQGRYPAPLAILRCVYEGLQVPFERGLALEAQQFARCLASPVAARTIRTMFFGLHEIHKGSARPAGLPAASVPRIGVLGAGMMGSGIARAAAARGFEVVLKDVEAVVARLAATPVPGVRLTAREQDLDGCALVVEAVPEDRTIKEAVLREAEARIPEDALLASNTSTLPITSLAAYTRLPERFLGLHFFSPVEKMPLVEIIRGRATSPASVARAFDFVRALGKTPIVVADGRGFFTSRVFSAYVNAGLACLQEGVVPALVENAGRMAGMPVGPLAVADEVGLDLILHIVRQTEQDLGRADEGPSAALSRLFVERLGRKGRKSGHGFYDYPETGRKRLWPGLKDHFPAAAAQPGVEEVQRRLLHAQAVEAARAFEDGILTSPRDGDVASILGWGFAPWTGGVFSYLDDVGLPTFVEECDALARASRQGALYTPPALLRTMAAEGRSFHGA
jgi:3-hydroxyacyl-CoA dehydrogenase/enoyl-CoA hydratase/3-hydroxybutyryl-CoA epimerase